MGLYRDYKNGKIDIKTLSGQLKKDFKLQNYFLLSFEEIAYQCLCMFKLNKLDNSSESIKLYCKNILRATPFLEDFEGDEITAFLGVFLDLKFLPIVKKLELEHRIKIHLRSIEDLLTFYEGLPIVMCNSVEPVRPRNHQEKTQLIFYKRTLAKREQILDYLTSERLDRRAIEKASASFKEYYYENSKDIELQFIYQDDFPYVDMLLNHKIEFGIDIERLDYRMINPIRNKWKRLEGEFDPQEGYSKAFDRALKKELEPKKFFQDIIKDLKSVPIVSARLNMFKELKALFLDKKWFGFYALALPQVEGIFAEMLDLINEKKSQGSLTDKVHIVRPYYSSSDFYFDYYEFYLPNWRNQFAHIGKVDDVEIKCYYLLLDIKDLLITCISLNSPLSKLSGILKEGADGFSHVGHLSELILLINEIDKKKQVELVRKNLDTYMYKEIVPGIDLETFFRNLKKDFELSLSKFENHLELGMYAIKEIPFKIFQKTPADIVRIISVVEQAYEKYDFLLREDLKLLLDTANVLHYFAKMFPKISSSVKTEINSFQKKFETQLQVLRILDSRAKFELPEDFLLMRRSMTHAVS